MSRTVYALFYGDEAEPSGKHYFYVGRSIDMFRREKQHHYAKKKGHEDKYEFIRELERKGIAWRTEALREIAEDEYPPDNERWYVIKLTREGHALMNMRHGSAEHRRELAEQVQNPRIRNAADVRMDRARRKYASSRKLRRRVLEAALRKEGIPNVFEDKLLPPVLRKRLIARNCKCVEKGVTLSEVIRSERAQPMFRRLFERIASGA
jgi:hypothetical protein